MAIQNSSTITRWTVSVSKETDTSLRCFLAQRGMKKGDISKFVEDAVKWRVFEQTLAEVREQVADIPPEEMQAIIDEATTVVRQEIREEFARKEVNGLAGAPPHGHGSPTPHGPAGHNRQNSTRRKAGKGGGAALSETVTSCFPGTTSDRV